MKYFLLLFSICFFCLPVLAQTDRARVALFPDKNQGRWQSPVYEVPLEGSTPFLSYFLAWTGTDVELSIRFSEDGLSWTDWESMPRDEHSPEQPISVLRATEGEMRFFQLENSQPESTIRQVDCHFFNPGATETELRPVSGSGGRSCSDIAPPVVNRSDWCPSKNCAEHPNPSFTNVTHLVVHHSAGTNQSDDWPAVVRAIWDYHVNGRGWSDIGYNWLVDPKGRIYQGRSNDAIGAHFCGTNTGTIGVCMLGNFMEEYPKPEAIGALKKLLHWKACENDIDPLASVYHNSSEKSLPTIIGHRDGCATACPGDLFYPQLEEVRQTLTEDQTTAVKDPDHWLDFQVYPNPSPGQFQLAIPDAAPLNIQARLIDILGQPVLDPIPLKADRSLSFNTNLSNGTYFLILQSDGQIVGVKKVTIFQ